MSLESLQKEFKQTVGKGARGCHARNRDWLIKQIQNSSRKKRQKTQKAEIQNSSRKKKQKTQKAESQNSSHKNRQKTQKAETLPTVRAVDEQGRDFSTASLRGSYTVLVFGCLT